jgi:hypothetical protein
MTKIVDMIKYYHICDKSYDKLDFDFYQKALRPTGKYIMSCDKLGKKFKKRISFCSKFKFSLSRKLRFVQSLKFVRSFHSETLLLLLVNSPR